MCRAAKWSVENPAIDGLRPDKNLSASFQLGAAYISIFTDALRLPKYARDASTAEGLGERVRLDGLRADGRCDLGSMID
jgi:hypothetical protein